MSNEKGHRIAAVAAINVPAIGAGCDSSMRDIRVSRRIARADPADAHVL
jgi:hypothetical protein